MSTSTALFVSLAGLLTLVVLEVIKKDGVVVLRKLLTRVVRIEAAVLLPAEERQHIAAWLEAVVEEALDDHASGVTECLRFLVWTVPWLAIKVRIKKHTGV